MLVEVGNTIKLRSDNLGGLHIIQDEIGLPVGDKSPLSGVSDVKDQDQNQDQLGAFVCKHDQVHFHLLNPRVTEVRMKFL